MRRQKIIDEAQKIINEFLLCMPFKDKKLGSCDEKPELIEEMELLAATQCALICAIKCREQVLSIDSSSQWFWDEIIAEIESKIQ
jgi:hypothetical protein